MGHNIDLTSLLGLPKKVKCKICGKKTDSFFEDYDIDCGDPEASNNDGLLTLKVNCLICENENVYTFKTIKHD